MMKTADEIRSLAIKLLGAPSAHLTRSLLDGRRLIFRVSRRKNALQPPTTISIELDDSGGAFRAPHEHFKERRDEILEKLIAALEAEERISESR